jgi:hypothetical protein
MVDFVLYAVRWQLSTPILWLVIKKLGPGIKGTVIANFIGSIVFFFVDRWIFHR